MLVLMFLFDVSLEKCFSMEYNKKQYQKRKRLYKINAISIRAEE